MPDRMIPVPVSLIERTIEVADEQGIGALASKYRALLPQPTPTVEHECTGPHADVRPEACVCSAGHDHAHDEQVSEPPRIEDMALGTEFLCEGKRVPGFEHLMRVTEIYRDGTRILWCLTHEFGAAAPYVDPSTIRNVQRPKEAA